MTGPTSDWCHCPILETLTNESRVPCSGEHRLKRGFILTHLVTERVGWKNTELCAA